jgi:hypothetical protein
LYFRKKVALETYCKKTDLAIHIISDLLTKIPFDEVLLASVAMLEFLIKRGIRFTIRIPRNRKIKTGDGVEE